MPSMKFAAGPLYAALTVGVAGVLMLLLPRMGVALPVQGDLIGAGLGIITVVLIAISAFLGSRAEDDDTVDPITAADLVPSVSFGPQSAAPDAPLTKEQKKEMKAAEKRAKAEAAERAKFEKRAQKEAEKAAKAAAKGKAPVDTSGSDWIGDIKQLPEGEAFGQPQTVAAPAFFVPPQQTASPQTAPAFQPVAPPPTPAFAPAPAAPSSQPPMQPVVVAEPVAAAGAMMMGASRPQHAAPPAAAQQQPAQAPAQPSMDSSDIGVATAPPMYEEGAVEPDWASAAYDDPSFSIPFADDESNLATHDGAEDGENVTSPESTDNSDADVLDLVLVEEFDEPLGSGAESDSDSPDDLEMVDVVVVETVPHDEENGGDDADLTDTLAIEEALKDYADSMPDPEPEDSSIPSFPDVDTSLEEEPEDESITEVEERLDQLAHDVLGLIENARQEVRVIRRKSEDDRRRHNNQVTTLATALNDSRDELTRLAEELAEAGAQRRAALDAESLLAQAEIESAKAEQERKQTIARLRQLRVAILKRDPVDEALLEIVERSIRDLLGETSSEETHTHD